jgi:hypothetical protein
VSSWADTCSTESSPLRGAIPRTAQGPKLCPNVASINTTQHQNPQPRTITSWLPLKAISVVCTTLWRICRCFNSPFMCRCFKASQTIRMPPCRSSPIAYDVALDVEMIEDMPSNHTNPTFLDCIKVLNLLRSQMSISPALLPCWRARTVAITHFPRVLVLSDRAFSKERCPH